MSNEIDNQPLYTFRMHWFRGLFSWIRWYSQRLTVYRTKVVYETGLFTREERVIPISKITDIRVTKGCIAGVLGYGNLYIETAGSTGTEIAVLNIDNPDYARDLIVHVVESAD